MPTQWYAACPECFHVDVGDALQELPDGCSNCGFADHSRRKRLFLEPKGFVTSVADNKGKDPGSSRRRVRPADEARLITAPRPEQFEPTELPFLQTALLLARGSEGSELRGSLFVANRGTYGEGYYRCSYCNFCSPVQTGAKKKGGTKAAGKSAPKKFVHTDPGSGKQCKQDVLPRMGLDFAHTFNTDVRLLRLLAPLPEPIEEGVSERHFQVRIARTVAEACRLGASDLLHLHAGELRSTYRLYTTAGNILEVVLYDGVPGGAGYSARLGTPQFSFPQLMVAARKRLECPAGCDSACRSCLCDYGNQRHWDSFVRKESLAWLEALMDGRATGGGPGRYVPWTKPSLSGLSERFAAFALVNVIGASLAGASSYEEAELNQLLSWLQAGKQVRLYVANKLEAHPKDYQLLMLYRHLYPWMQADKLRVFLLKELDGRTAGSVPRVFASLEYGAPLVRQTFPVQGLLDSLITAPAELGVVDDETRELVEAALAEATEYPPEHFSDGNRMSMWEFGVGTPRPLTVVFAALKGLHVKRLAVRDPYCGAEVNRVRLKQLLQFLKQHVSALECVDVYCSEVRSRDRSGADYVEHRYDVARHVERILNDVGVPRGEAMVKELGRGRTFHDRELAFDAVDAVGCDVAHKYFLTGGIDYLLDERSDTKVFHAQASK
jgi:hypothetical protein